MLRRLKQLIKRVLKEIGFANKNVKTFLDFLIENGNVIVGANSDISKLVVAGYSFTKEFPNVIIGEDCHILGQIELQSNEAQVIIGDRVFIGPDTKLFCRDKIVIQDDILISWGCTLIDTNAHSLSSIERINDVVDWKKGWQYKNWDVVESKTISINSQCWIGFNSIITKGVTLNKGCIVGSGSVVTKSFNEYSVIGGNPAKLIKYTN